MVSERQVIAFARRVGVRNSIWVVSAQGGEARTLLGDRFDNDTPTWSADSKRIVFVTDRAGGHKLWDVEVASGRLRQLTFGVGTDLDAIIGPNGLAFSHFSHSQELRIRSLDLGVDEQLTADTAKSFRARFSPSGNQIAYDSNRTGNFDIWVIDLRTGKQRNLTNHPSTDVAPDWSHDGKTIAFLSERNKASELWTVNVDDGTTRRLSTNRVPGPTTMSTGAGVYVRWSPGDRKIGFLAGTHGQSLLWVIDANGNGARQLTRGALAFDWFRDSDHIVYTRLAPDGSGRSELALNDLRDAHEQVLYRGPHTDLATAAGGNELLFVTGESHYRQNLFLLPVF